MHQSTCKEMKSYLVRNVCYILDVILMKYFTQIINIAVLRVNIFKIK